MAFDVQHSPNQVLTGLNALLNGLDQESRRTNEQNIQNDFAVSGRTGQAISNIGNSLFGRATQRFQAEQAQERIRLDNQLREQAQARSTRERFIASQVNQANHLLQMPPHAAAELYSNNQEIARTASDGSIPEFERRQMVDILTQKNEALVKANPPPTPPTITDQEQSGQIKYDTEHNVMVYPNGKGGYNVRALKPSVEFSDWVESVTAESLRLQAEGMTESGADAQAQVNMGNKLKLFRELRGQPTTGDAGKPLLDQVRRKAVGVFGDEGGGGAPPQDPRQQQIDAGAQGQVEQAINANAQGLTQLVAGLTETLGVDNPRDVSTWSGQTLAQAAPMAQRFEKFLFIRYPNAASLAGVDEVQLQRLKAIAALSRQILDEADERAKNGVTIDEQNSNR